MSFHERDKKTECENYYFSGERDIQDKRIDKDGIA
jgi:hypothetical protein